MHRLFSRVALLASVSTILASQASAQVNFQGSTAGCFYLASGAQCTPTTNSTLVTNSTTRATFTGATSFNVTSSAGVATFVPFNNTNLGMLQRGTGGAAPGFNFDPYNFLLRITFTMPAGTSPNPGMVIADLNGSISDQGGALLVNFGAPQTFAYNGGTFTLALNPMTVTYQGGAEGNITGTATVNVGGTITTAPEPSSYALMAAGLAGLGVVARRRRKA